MTDKKAMTIEELRIRAERMSELDRYFDFITGDACLDLLSYSLADAEMCIQDGLYRDDELEHNYINTVLRLMQNDWRFLRDQGGRELLKGLMAEFRATGDLSEHDWEAVEVFQHLIHRLKDYGLLPRTPEDNAHIEAFSSDVQRSRAAHRGVRSE